MFLPDVLESASEKAGTRRSTIIVGAGVFIVLFLFFNFGEGFIVNMIGFFYPAYASFKAIESTCKDDDRQWCAWGIAPIHGRVHGAGGRIGNVSLLYGYVCVWAFGAG